MKNLIKFWVLFSLTSLYSFNMKDDIQNFQIEDFISSDTTGDKFEKYDTLILSNDTIGD